MGDTMSVKLTATRTTITTNERFWRRVWTAVLYVCAGDFHIFGPTTVHLSGVEGLSLPPQPEPRRGSLKS
jgi:hypothetical protein